MEFFLDADQLLLRERVRTWAEQNLFAGHPEGGAIESAARDLVTRLGQKGFLAYVAPKKFGGVRETVQARDLCVLREELARGSALADIMLATQALGSYPIALAANDEQKRRYLLPIARGETIAAFALTEPEAGSDISAITTRATRHGKEYRLTGVKHLISNAGLADTYVVFAVTEPEMKLKGITAFVVEGGTPGLVIKEKTTLLSPHPIGTIAFEQCLIAESQRLGREGEGGKLALRTLDMLRCTVAAAAAGLAQRALEEALSYSQARRQFGRRLADFQATQFKLAEMATELEAARLLAYRAAWAHDRGKPDSGVRSSMAKLYASEAAQRIVDEALQIHGGKGLVAGGIMERLYRDVRALRIYEGTSEIQKLVIARSLLGK